METIKLALTVEEINYLLGLISKQSIESSLGIFIKIRDQANIQLERKAEPEKDDK